MDPKFIYCSTIMESLIAALASPFSGAPDPTNGYSVWIGGHDRFRWTSKIDSQTIDYTFWEPANPALGQPGMPDNNLGRSVQNCIRMQRRPAPNGLNLVLSGHWDDIECGVPIRAGVCQARPLCDPRH